MRVFIASSSYCARESPSSLITTPPLLVHSPLPSSHRFISNEKKRKSVAPRKPQQQTLTLVKRKRNVLSIIGMHLLTAIIQLLFCQHFYLFVTAADPFFRFAAAQSSCPSSPYTTLSPFMSKCTLSGGNSNSRLRVAVTTGTATSSALPATAEGSAVSPLPSTDPTPRVVTFDQCQISNIIFDLSTAVSVGVALTSQSQNVAIPLQFTLYRSTLKDVFVELNGAFAIGSSVTIQGCNIENKIYSQTSNNGYFSRGRSNFITIDHGGAFEEQSIESTSSLSAAKFSHFLAAHSRVSAKVNRTIVYVIVDNQIRVDSSASSSFGTMNQYMALIEFVSPPTEVVSGNVLLVNSSSARQQLAKEINDAVGHFGAPATLSLCSSDSSADGGGAASHSRQRILEGGVVTPIATAAIQLTLSNNQVIMRVQNVDTAYSGLVRIPSPLLRLVGSIGNGDAVGYVLPTAAAGTGGGATGGGSSARSRIVLDVASPWRSGASPSSIIIGTPTPAASTPLLLLPFWESFIEISKNSFNGQEMMKNPTSVTAATSGNALIRPTGTDTALVTPSIVIGFYGRFAVIDNYDLAFIGPFLDGYATASLTYAAPSAVVVNTSSSSSFSSLRLLSTNAPSAGPIFVLPPPITALNISSVFAIERNTRINSNPSSSTNSILSFTGSVSIGAGSDGGGYSAIDLNRVLVLPLRDDLCPSAGAPQQPSSSSAPVNSSRVVGAYDLDSHAWRPVARMSPAIFRITQNRFQGMRGKLVGTFATADIAMGPTEASQSFLTSDTSGGKLEICRNAYEGVDYNGEPDKEFVNSNFAKVGWCTVPPVTTTTTTTQPPTTTTKPPTKTKPLPVTRTPTVAAPQTKTLEKDATVTVTIGGVSDTATMGPRTASPTRTGSLTVSQTEGANPSNTLHDAEGTATDSHDRSPSHDVTDSRLLTQQATRSLSRGLHGTNSGSLLMTRSADVSKSIDDAAQSSHTVSGQPMHTHSDGRTVTTTGTVLGEKVSRTQSGNSIGTFSGGTTASSSIMTTRTASMLDTELRTHTLSMNASPLPFTTIGDVLAAISTTPQPTAAPGAAYTRAPEPEPAPAAVGTTVTTGIVGVSTSPMSGLDSLMAIQVMSIFASMACRVPGVGGDSMQTFLNPLEVGGDRYGKLVGQVILVAIIAALYAIVLGVLAHFVGYVRASDLLRHPRAIPMVHQLVLSGFAFQCCMLLYGNDDITGDERFVGAVGLLLCLASVLAYPLVTWMGFREYGATALGGRYGFNSCGSDGTGITHLNSYNDDNSSDCEPQPFSPAVSGTEHFANDSSSNAMSTTAEATAMRTLAIMRRAVALTSIDEMPTECRREDTATTAEEEAKGNGTAAIAVKLAAAIANAQRQQPHEAEQMAGRNGDVSRSDAHTANEEAIDGNASPPNAAAVEIMLMSMGCSPNSPRGLLELAKTINAEKAPRHDDEDDDGAATLSLPQRALRRMCGTVLEDSYRPYTKEDLALVWAPLRWTVTPKTYWLRPVLRTSRCVHGGLRPDRSRLAVAHHLYRAVLVCLVCTIPAQGEDWCVVILAIAAAICFAHACFILLTMCYRVPMENIAQSLQSAVVGAIALNNALGGDTQSSTDFAMVMLAGSMLSMGAGLSSFVIEWRVLGPAVAKRLRERDELIMLEALQSVDGVDGAEGGFDGRMNGGDSNGSSSNRSGSCGGSDGMARKKKYLQLGVGVGGSGAALGFGKALCLVDGDRSHYNGGCSEDNPHRREYEYDATRGDDEEDDGRYNDSCPLSSEANASSPSPSSPPFNHNSENTIRMNRFGLPLVVEIPTLMCGVGNSSGNGGKTPNRCPQQQRQGSSNNNNSNPNNSVAGGSNTHHSSSSSFAASRSHRSREKSNKRRGTNNRGGSRCRDANEGTPLCGSPSDNEGFGDDEGSDDDGGNGGGGVHHCSSVALTSPLSPHATAVGISICRPKREVLGSGGEDSSAHSSSGGGGGAAFGGVGLGRGSSGTATLLRSTVNGRRQNIFHGDSTAGRSGCDYNYDSNYCGGDNIGMILSNTSSTTAANIMTSLLRPPQAATLNALGSSSVSSSPLRHQQTKNDNTNHTTAHNCPRRQSCFAIQIGPGEELLQVPPREQQQSATTPPPMVWVGGVGALGVGRCGDDDDELRGPLGARDSIMLGASRAVGGSGGFGATHCPRQGLTRISNGSNSNSNGRRPSASAAIAIEANEDVEQQRRLCFAQDFTVTAPVVGLMAGGRGGVETTEEGDRRRDTVIIAVPACIMDHNVITNTTNTNTVRSASGSLPKWERDNNNNNKAASSCGFLFSGSDDCFFPPATISPPSLLDKNTDKGGNGEGGEEAPLPSYLFASSSTVHFPPTIVIAAKKEINREGGGKGEEEEGGFDYDNDNDYTGDAHRQALRGDDRRQRPKQDEEHHLLRQDERQEQRVGGANHHKVKYRAAAAAAAVPLSLQTIQQTNTPSAVPATGVGVDTRREGGGHEEESSREAVSSYVRKTPSFVDIVHQKQRERQQQNHCRNHSQNDDEKDVTETTVATTTAATGTILRRSRSVNKLLPSSPTKTDNGDATTPPLRQSSSAQCLPLSLMSAGGSLEGIGPNINMSVSVKASRSGCPSPPHLQQQHQSPSPSSFVARMGRRSPMDHPPHRHAYHHHGSSGGEEEEASQAWSSDRGMGIGAGAGRRGGSCVVTPSQSPPSTIAFMPHNINTINGSSSLRHQHRNHDHNDTSIRASSSHILEGSSILPLSLLGIGGGGRRQLQGHGSGDEVSFVDEVGTATPTTTTTTTCVCAPPRLAIRRTEARPL